MRDVLLIGSRRAIYTGRSGLESEGMKVRSDLPITVQQTERYRYLLLATLLMAGLL